MKVSGQLYAPPIYRKGNNHDTHWIQGYAKAKTFWTLWRRGGGTDYLESNPIPQLSSPHPSDYTDRHSSSS
jgi:hypothetical protein